MTWQVIAERKRGPLQWPTKCAAAIDEWRAKVEAGTHIMAHRHTPETVELVGMKRAKRDDPVTTWAGLRASRRQVEISQKHKAGKRG